jgi:lysozyme
MNTRKLSLAGEAYLKSTEALVLHVYTDQAGYATIGWGHKLVSGTDHFEGAINVAQAELLFRHDIAGPEATVNIGVTVPLSQNEFDALVIFVFNVGASAFLHSTLLRVLNAGEVEASAAHFLDWIYVTDPKTKAKVISHGLQRRRTEERRIFLDGY